MPVPRSLRRLDAAELEAATRGDRLPVRAQARHVLALGRARAASVSRRSTSPTRSRRASSARLSCARTRPVLVQELAGGARETIKLFRDEGKRARPPSRWSSTARGRRSAARPSCAGRSPPPADALELAERLVAEIGLDGYSEVEFRRDARDRPLLMEINPRLSQSVELASRAGVDFAAHAARMGPRRHDPAPRAARVGLRVGWLAGDLRLLVGAVAGSPPPSRRAGRRSRAIALRLPLHRARLEGFDLRDRAADARCGRRSRSAASPAPVLEPPELAALAGDDADRVEDACACDGRARRPRRADAARASPCAAAS